MWSPPLYIDMMALFELERLCACRMSCTFNTWQIHVMMQSGGCWGPGRP